MKRKRIPYFLFLNSIMLLGLIGLSSCDSKNAGTQDNITGVDQVEGPELSTSAATTSSNLSSGSGSSTFSLEITSSGSDINTKGKSPGTNDYILLNGETMDELNVTGTLQVTKGSASTSSDLQRVNPINRTYKNTPDNIAYNGISELNYTIDGVSHSVTLNTEQQQIIDDLQQKLNEARNYGMEEPTLPCRNEDGLSSPQCPEINTATHEATSEYSLDAMSDQEVITWLEEKGYEVENLGDRQFRVQRNYSEEAFGKSMSITSIFDANTGRMLSDYSVSKDGKNYSQQLPGAD